MRIDPGSTRSPSANGAHVAAHPRTVAPGFAAGVLGGVVMVACVALSAAVSGLHLLSPLEALGQTFAGPTPRPAGAWTALGGLGVHLAFSGVLGVLFAALLPHDMTPGNAAVVAVGFALVVLAVMSSSVLPAVNPALRRAMPALSGGWIIAHAAYGATVGLVAQVLRHRRRGRAGEARARVREAHA